MSRVLESEAWAKYPNATADGKTDYKAWAKRFVYRAERSDKSLLRVQVDFAYEALELEKPKVG